MPLGGSGVQWGGLGRLQGRCGGCMCCASAVLQRVSPCRPPVRRPVELAIHLCPMRKGLCWRAARGGCFNLHFGIGGGGGGAPPP